MVWFKVDDNLATHPKTLAAGNAAMGMWVRAGSWSSQQLTEGFIPDAMVGVLGGQKQAKQLVSADLWERVEGGYRFHQWSERQPTKEKVERDRNNAATRKERWKERQQDDVRNAVPESFGTVPRPDPTRPDPEDHFGSEVMSSTVRTAQGAAA